MYLILKIHNKFIYKIMNIEIEHDKLKNNHLFIN